MQYWQHGIEILGQVTTLCANMIKVSHLLAKGKRGFGMHTYKHVW